jgi:hypothetical protein
MSRVHHIPNISSDFIILADAHGGTINTLDSLYGAGMGQFEWIMSPDGLLECPALFQRLVKMDMNGLINVIVYIDNTLLDNF